MEDYQAETQKKLGPEDYEKMGKVLVQEIPKSGFFHNYHVFDEPVPGSVIEHYKEQGMTNEDEIVNTYRRGRAMSEYERLFGGAASKPKQPTP